MTSASNGLIAILKKSVVAVLRTGLSVGGTANGIVNGLGKALSAIWLVPVVSADTVRSSGRATAPLTSTPILIRSRRVRVTRHTSPSGRRPAAGAACTGMRRIRPDAARVRTTARDG